MTSNTPPHPATDLHARDIAAVLAALGYQPNQAELAEVTVRFNALMDGLRALDAFDLYHVEPNPLGVEEPAS